MHIWQLPPRTSRFEIPVPCWPSEGRNNARVEESAVTSLATALNWRRRHKEVLVGSRTPCWQARGMGLDIRDACQSKLKQPGRHARCGTWCVGTSSVLGLDFFALLCEHSASLVAQLQTKDFHVHATPAIKVKQMLDQTSFGHGLCLRTRQEFLNAIEAQTQQSTWPPCWRLHVQLAEEHGALMWRLGAMCS